MKFLRTTLLGLAGSFAGSVLAAESEVFMSGARLERIASGEAFLADLESADAMAVWKEKGMDAP
jgi:hypothetical protein